MRLGITFLEINHYLENLVTYQEVNCEMICLRLDIQYVLLQVRLSVATSSIKVVLLQLKKTKRRGRRMRKRRRR